MLTALLQIYALVLSPPPFFSSLLNNLIRLMFCFASFFLAEGEDYSVCCMWFFEFNLNLCSWFSILFIIYAVRDVYNIFHRVSEEKKKRRNSKETISQTIKSFWASNARFLFENYNPSCLIKRRRKENLFRRRIDKVTLNKTTNL